jgi:hypothetical protein
LSPETERLSSPTSSPFTRISAPHAKHRIASPTRKDAHLLERGKDGMSMKLAGLDCPSDAKNNGSGGLGIQASGGMIVFPSRKTKFQSLSR